MALIGNNAPPSNQPPASRPKGTGFTNLNRVLGANQNNKLGQTVGGGLSQQVGQAQSGIKSGLQGFQTEAQKQNIATDENKQKAQTLINDPTQATDQDVDQFSTFRSGRYAGPTDLQNKNQVQNQANQASTLGGLAGSAEGRQALLQRFVGGAGYNQGQQRLDSLLLGQAKAPELNSAVRNANTLNQQLNQASGAAQAQAKQIAGGNQQFADETKQSLNTKLGGVQSDIDSEVNKYNTQRESDQQRLTRLNQELAYDPDNQNQTISQEDYEFLKSTGYDPETQNALNLNLGEYLKLGDVGNRQALTSQEQLNKINALNKLGGTDLTAPFKEFANQYTVNPNNVGSLIGKKTTEFNDKAFTQAREASSADQLEQLLNTVYGVEGSRLSPDQVRQQYAKQGIKSSYDMLQKEQEKNKALSDAQQFFMSQLDHHPYSHDVFKGDVKNAGRSQEEVTEDVNSFIKNLQTGAGLQASPEQIAAMREQYVKALTSPVQVGSFVQKLDMYGNPVIGSTTQEQANEYARIGTGPLNNASMVTDFGSLGNAGLYFAGDTRAFGGGAAAFGQNLYNNSQFGNLRKILAAPPISGERTDENGNVINKGPVVG